MEFKAILIAAAVALTALPGANASTSVPEDREYLDVEIWLSEGRGRYGDREFSIRGGSQKHPSSTGCFQVEWKSRKWWSRQWDAWMPYSMFYHNGEALHQGVLRGHSHGCIRLSEDTAKYLFKVTKEKKTRVFVYP